MKPLSAALSALLIGAVCISPAFAATATSLSVASTSSPFASPLFTSSLQSDGSNSSHNGGGSNGTSLLIGGAVAGGIVIGAIALSAGGVVTGTSVASEVAANTAFKSAGGYVVGPTGVCLQLDGGVGELFHLIPDARFIPLVPPDYIWSPTTITLPVPERPPVIGQYVLGKVYPNFLQGICIKTTFPFFAVGGWKFFYMGESTVPTIPGASAEAALLAAGLAPL